MFNMLKSKIHRAVVTQADLNYVGSITIDTELMNASGIREYEKVLVVDVENGNRIETYAIEGEKGSNIICMNGAAARCVMPGDHVIIMSFAMVDEQNCSDYKPKVVFVDENNKIIEVKECELHGEIK